MQRIIALVICLLLSAFGVVGCQNNSDIAASSTEDIDGAYISLESEKEKDNDFSNDYTENDSSYVEGSMGLEDESKLVENSNGGIVLPDDEW